jgi:glycerophosphoryl diester phosphodiesterase
MLQLPNVIGHRGAAAYAPENTLASFRQAQRRGATWVEIDVKLTADGVPIVMHDSSLKRTMGIDRLVAETRRAELPAEVPTFEQAIACFEVLGLGCNVEIKPCDGREIETAVATVALLSSFKDACLAAAREHAPEFLRALLIDELADDWRPRAEAVAATGVNTNGARLAPGRAREIKQAGYALAAYTINDPGLARSLVAVGVDCIITDAPDVILAALSAD